MATPQASLTSLAATISEATAAITEILEKQGHPAPSFAQDGPSDYPKLPELMGPRFQLLGAISDLHRLAMGPMDMAFVNPLHLNHDALVLDIFNQFNFWDAVPLGGSATVAEISQRTTLPELLVRRLFNFSTSTHMFAYDDQNPDTVVHTSLSAVMVKNKLMRSWVRHNMEEARPSCVHTPEALRKYSAGRKTLSEEVTESGFSVANVDKLDRPESFWEYVDRDVDGKPKGYRAQEFSNAMQAAASASAIKMEDVLRTAYDWGSLGEATVVDIGGSSGHDALVVTEAFPKLNFIVQDRPELEGPFQARVSQDFQKKIQFQAHDFFSAQDIKADVYFLKMILHDWPDKYAIKILTPLLPHLKSGSRLVLCESIQPPPNAPLPLTVRRLLACADLQMLVAFNSLERTVEQWKTLVKKVDEHLDVTFVSNVPGSPCNFVEIKFIS